MASTPEFSEARKALLEKYLRGEIRQAAKPASNVLQPSSPQSTDLPKGVTALQSGGSKRPFFYLHGDWRGKIFYCHPLARDLGPDQPFYLVDTYDLDGVPFPPSIEEMAAFHLQQIRSVQPEGPYLLGGFCCGGLLAYEMALQLLAEGQKTDLLLMIDADYPLAEDRLMRRFFTRLGQWLGMNEAQQLDFQLTFRYVRESFYYCRKTFSWRKKRNSGQASETSEEKKGFVFPTPRWLLAQGRALRNHWPHVYEWSSFNYVPSKLYPGKLTLFWDEVDTYRRVGWEPIVAAKGQDAEIHILPGNHITCRTDHLQDFTEALRTCLNAAQVGQ